MVYPVGAAVGNAAAQADLAEIGQQHQLLGVGRHGARHLGFAQIVVGGAEFRVHAHRRQQRQVGAVAMDLGNRDFTGGRAYRAAHRAAQHDELVRAAARGAHLQGHVERIGDDGQARQLGQFVGQHAGGAARVQEQGLSAGHQAGRRASNGALVFDARVHAFGDGRFAVHRHRAAVHAAQLPHRLQLQQIPPDRLPRYPEFADDTVGRYLLQ
jgi:hypothetical protein